MAVLEDLGAFAMLHLRSILLLCVAIHFLSNYWSAGARSIPGPFWAKLTNLWRFIDAARGQSQFTLLKLHRKHGQYVRLGPRVVSVNRIDTLKQIYGINKGYTKVRLSRTW